MYSNPIWCGAKNEKEGKMEAMLENALKSSVSKQYNVNDTKKQGNELSKTVKRMKPGKVCVKSRYGATVG